MFHLRGGIYEVLDFLESFEFKSVFEKGVRG